MVTIAVGDDDTNSEMRGSSPTQFCASRAQVFCRVNLLAGGFYYICFGSVGHGRSCAGSGPWNRVGCFPHLAVRIAEPGAGWELLFMLIEFQFCCFSAENDGRRL